MSDDLSILCRGIVLGLMVAAPVGPVGLLCIRRTIQKGLPVGFASGFGAAFADALFSAMAAFGVTAIVDILQTYMDPIRFFGGAFLLFVAWHTWHDVPRQPHPEEVEQRYLRRFGATNSLATMFRAMATSFLITLSNPATLFGVMAVVATFGGLKSSLETSTLVAGIFSGSSLWWLILSGGTWLLRGHFTEARVTTMNKVMGFLIGLMAVGAMALGVLNWSGISLPVV